MADKQPAQSDGLEYVPKEIRDLLSNYQNNPDSYSDRQAIFTKLYNGGGDQRKLAEAMAVNGNAEGYQGLANQLKLAYQPANGDSMQKVLARNLLDKKNKSVPNLNAVENGDTSQQQSTQPNSAWNAAGIYGNLPQSSALSFLMKQGGK